jgi:hypothetical protein
MLGEFIQEPANRQFDGNILDEIDDLIQQTASKSEQVDSAPTTGTRVTLQPGSTSQRSEISPITGTTRETSSTGFSAILTVPPLVGDVYLSDIEGAPTEANVFARCIRCRLIREDAFEAGFVFFSDLDSLLSDLNW